MQLVDDVKDLHLTAACAKQLRRLVVCCFKKMIDCCFCQEECHADGSSGFAVVDAL